MYRAPAAAHVVSQHNFADLRAESAGLTTSVAATTLSRIATWPTGMELLFLFRPFDSKEASGVILRIGVIGTLIRPLGTEYCNTQLCNTA